MRRKQPYIRELLIGLLGVTLAAVAWADITNTATALFTDAGGMPTTVLSNTVVVVTSSSTLTPATPTLDLPAFVPINATIQAGYSGSDPAFYFDWSFTPVSSIPAGNGAGTLGTISAAPSAQFKTNSARADLSLQVLGLGPYRVTVTVFDSNGNASSPATAYVTLVSADLSGAHVYPNPWRSDKHSGRPITFDNLALNSQIKIFTVSGHFVKELPASSTSVAWDLTTDSGDKAASGVYVYLITSDSGEKKRGKFAIIK